MDRKKQYIRNQKDPGGSKFLSSQDVEDHEQEQQIKAWLEREGRADEYSFQHINSKGLPRNTGVRAQVRLDAKVQENSSTTFENYIAGSDGRDLECAGGSGPIGLAETEQLENEFEFFNGVLSKIIGCINNREAKEWATETYLRYLEEILW